MAEALNHNIRRARLYFKSAFVSIVGLIAVGLLKLFRLIGRKYLADYLGFAMRIIGPWRPEHIVGRNNLKAAFPDKLPEEVDRILSGTWDNLGRVVAEFAHLDRIRIAHPDESGSGDITYEQIALTRLDEVRRSAKPTIFFAGHLANWEIPALIQPFFGFDMHVLYRAANIAAIDNAILKMRTGCMGTLVPAGLSAPIRLAHALHKGQLVGMLVDQHFDKHEKKGVDVTFFGRTCKANPLFAYLAQTADCPIRGYRVIRLPDRNRFRVELTEALNVPRGADGKIDIQGTMQVITSVIEGWVREYPEQWLWLHRRWR